MGKSKGKYAHIQRERILTTDPSKSDRVTAEKKAILQRIADSGQTPDSQTLVRLYAAVRRDKDDLSEQVKEAEVTVEAIKQMVIEQFETDDILALRTTSGDTVRLHYEPYLVVEEQEVFRQWCIVRGMEKQMHLHPSRAQSMVKEMLLQNLAEPDGTHCFNLAKIRLEKGVEEA